MVIIQRKLDGCGQKGFNEGSCAVRDHSINGKPKEQLHELLPSLVLRIKFVTVLVHNLQQES
jgi:hypothetical protein